MPAPMGAPATICGQGVLTFEAQAHQKSPGGRRQPPTIIGGRRVSGVAVEAVRAAANVVRE